MYFRSPVTTPRAEGGAGAWSAMVISTLLVVAAGAYPGPAIDAADQAGRAVQAFQPPDTESAGPIPIPVQDAPLPGPPAPRDLLQSR
jgi:hypothetical protein